jgi:hypothetical protein
MAGYQCRFVIQGIFPELNIALERKKPSVGAEGIDADPKQGSKNHSRGLKILAEPLCLATLFCRIAVSCADFRVLGPTEEDGTMPISERPRAKRGSIPVAGWQRQPLGQAQRARIMEEARRREKATYLRGSRRHGGDLRETGLRVLWTLLYRGWGRAGGCDPALAQIALEARLARSTVQEALSRLRAAGILWWVPRGLVVAHRWVQVTSAYLFSGLDRWSPLPSDTGSRQPLESLGYNKAVDKEHTLPATPVTAREQQRLASKWGLPISG